MTPEQKASSVSRVAALTGLRGLAAASVVVFHVWQYGAANGGRFTAGPFGRVFTNLDIGVTFFFVLSGLLLYRPYARAFLAGREWPRLRNFAVARFLRIVPVYWAAVLVVAALADRWLFHHPGRLLANLFFAEFAIPSFHTNNLGVDNGSIVIVPSWSLVVEAGFYVMLPLAVVVALRLAGRRNRPLAAALVAPALLFAVGVIATVIEHSVSAGTLGDWNASFPVHSAQFAFGMAAAAVWARWERQRPEFPGLSAPIAAAVALAIIALAFKLHSRGWLTDADKGSLVAAPFALLLLLVVLSPSGGRVHTALGARVFVLMGLASYSIFLVHDPIIRVLRTRYPAEATPLGLLTMLFLVGGATALVTAISYRLLEKPCLALKQRLTAAAPAVTPIAFTSAVESMLVRLDRERAREFEVVADPRIRVDLQRLRPILMPLLRNALSYGAPPFIVCGETNRGGLRVDVADGGRGVDEAFVPRLFQPSTRSEASSAIPGAGMGLAQARSTARRLGGDITYAPAPRGAHFAITLPLPSISARPMPPPTSSPPPKTGMSAAKTKGFLRLSIEPS